MGIDAGADNKVDLDGSNLPKLEADLPSAAVENDAGGHINADSDVAAEVKIPQLGFKYNARANAPTSPKLPTLSTQPAFGGGLDSKVGASVTAPEVDLNANADIGATRMIKVDADGDAHTQTPKIDTPGFGVAINGDASADLSHNHTADIPSVESEAKGGFGIGLPSFGFGGSKKKMMMTMQRKEDSDSVSAAMQILKHQKLIHQM